jgi:hypothetical protein
MHRDVVAMHPDLHVHVLAVDVAIWAVGGEFSAGVDDALDQILVRHQSPSIRAFIPAALAWATRRSANPSTSPAINSIALSSSAFVSPSSALTSYLMFRLIFIPSRLGAWSAVQMREIAGKCTEFHPGTTSIDALIGTRENEAAPVTIRLSGEEREARQTQSPMPEDRPLGYIIRCSPSRAFRPSRKEGPISHIDGTSG